MSSSSKQKPPSKIADGKFELARKLGAGCFGEVYRGVNTETKEEVAVKFEDASSGAPQLEHEAGIIDLLKQVPMPQGIAECYYFGNEGRYRACVMELLGKSLEDRMQGCQGKFSTRSAVLVAEQALGRIEYLHSRGIVHRDIKPENFMFGIKGKVHHLYLIDFGLSKRYYDKKHTLMKQKLSLTGTARYASLNAHRGFEQSRRDDLEAIGHMFMYFLRSTLPWSGLEAKTKQEKYQKIHDKKESTPLSELCAGYPEEFMTYLEYTRNLEFTQRPDYNMLRGLFARLREQDKCEDHQFQWFDGKEPPGPLVALEYPAKMSQPDDQVASKRKGFCFCGGSAAKD